MIVYVAGKYSGKTQDDITENIDAARKVAIQIWESGHVALCPHLNTAHFENDCACGYEDYLKGDLALLMRCDAILMMDDWEDSRGAVGEHEFAKARGIPVYYYPEIPPHHVTEEKRPQQAEKFIETVMRMYRVHLDKNADYSPANIMGAGEIGLMTRTWDKIARLMNLMGFRIEIAQSVFEQPSKPKNESIDDTIMDLAVYAIIWQLYRKGAWGK